MNAPKYEDTNTIVQSCSHYNHRPGIPKEAISHIYLGIAKGIRLGVQ